MTREGKGAEKGEGSEIPSTCLLIKIIVDLAASPSVFWICQTSKNISSDSQNPDLWKMFHDLQCSHPQTAEQESQNNEIKINNER